MSKTKSAFFSDIDYDQQIIDKVYGRSRKQKIAELTNLYPEVISTKNFEQHVNNLQDIEVIFSTWGMLSLTKRELQLLPNLKVIFYAAGSVKSFAEPFLKNGIKIISAWQANAVPVAEFCLAQILLAAKSYHLNMRQYHSKPDAKPFCGPGNYNVKCTLLGAGAIATKLQELLKPFNINILVIPSRAKNRTTSLEEAFRTSFIVSNHFPDRNDNIGVLNASLFKLMPTGATFINTGRGAQVNESELLTVLKERYDLTALLDVTEPEPIAMNSPLLKLPNVYLTSHIAGSMNNELGRMADYMIEDFNKWLKNETIHNEINLGQFYQMA